MLGNGEDQVRPFQGGDFCGEHGFLICIRPMAVIISAIINHSRLANVSHKGCDMRQGGKDHGLSTLSRFKCF